MISTNETLCNPTLLEKRLLCTGEVSFFCQLAEGASPKVVEVLARPALRDPTDERCCRGDEGENSTMRGRALLKL